MAEKDGRSSMARRHRTSAILLSLAAAAMLGLAFAAVPIYRLVCQATGYGGTTQRVTSGSAVVADKVITVRFDANVAPGMPWEFHPDVPSMDVRIGETVIAYFKAHNPTSARVSGQAVFNVTPEIAGQFFNKLQCFCFTQQTLQAGETTEMPVSFYVDPDILKEPGAEDVNVITLSYTFYRADTDTAGLPEQPVKKAGG